MRDAANAPNSDSPRSASRRPTVLVADDYPENRRLLYFYLRDRFEVLQTATAEEAIETLRTREAEGTPVDLTILDLNFCDGMSGIDAIGVIRQDPALAASRVIALTAYAYPDDRGRCIAAGFDDYLAKPVFKPGLLEKISTLLAMPHGGDGAPSSAEGVWVERKG